MKSLHVFSCVIYTDSRGSSAKRGGMERSQSSTWDSGEENRNKLVKAASTSKLLSKVVKNAEKYVFGSFFPLCPTKTHAVDSSPHISHPTKYKKNQIDGSVFETELQAFKVIFLDLKKCCISKHCTKLT